MSNGLQQVELYLQLADIRMQCLHQVRMFTKVAMIFGCAWFAGTTIMPHIYRASGAKIGKRVTIRTLDLAECDLVEIGDDCVIEVCAEQLFFCGPMCIWLTSDLDQY